MPSMEWSLVLFTILVQTSVGLLLVSEAARLAKATSSGGLLSWQTPAACGLAALGLLLSLTHLGTPVNSVFTILNLHSSWLSREILCTGGFFLALLALAVLRAKAPEREARGVAALAVLLGLAAVAVMSNVYLLASVPMWDSMATVLSFFGTALLMGAVASGLLYAIQAGRAASAEGKPNLSGIFCAATALGLGLQFIGIPLGIAALGTADFPSLAGAFAFSPSGLGLMALRIVLVFFGAVLFAWAMFRRIASGDPRLLVRLSACALACVLAGEVLGRLMFYGSYMRIGL